MSKPSKNQRGGPKVKPVVHLCSEGHEQIRALVVPGFKGRARLAWLCPCNPEGAK